MNGRHVSVKAAALLAAAAVLAGCTTNLAKFSLVTTRNVDLSRLAELQRENRRVQGEDTRTVILFVSNKMQPSMKEALERAMESVPGCVALADATLHQEYATFILGGYSTYVVEGTPLIDPRLKGM